MRLALFIFLLLATVLTLHFRRIYIDDARFLAVQQEVSEERETIFDMGKGCR